MMMDDIDNHLDEVLGIVEKPREREITEKVEALLSITDDDR